MDHQTSQNPAQPVERLALNKKEACAALGGISDVTLWRLEKRGRISSIPGLRHKLYSMESLKRFVAGKESA